MSHHTTEKTKSMEKSAAGHRGQPKAHCIFLPFPLVGHMNPMLQFAKRLHHKGLQITFLVSKYVAKTTRFASRAISIATFSDGFDDGPPRGIHPDDIADRFLEVAPANLKEAVERIVQTGPAVSCIVYDSILEAGLEIAAELGIAAAAFFTQSGAVDHIFWEMHKGKLKVPLSGEEKDILIPGLPALEVGDLPSFIYGYGSYPSITGLLVNQFRGINKAKWLFLNSFYELEEEVIDYMAKSSPVKTIGPAIPSMYLDGRFSDDGEHGVSAYASPTDACLDWLNRRQPGSVVYVSFGSLAELGQDQMEELARGLQLSDRQFLWVVRSPEQAKIPEDFRRWMTAEKGLIVEWGPQLDVLGHAATSCFVTHCGWNSTIEALSLGVPMLAMPQWTDQTTNAKFVTDVWKIGVRVRAGENGVVGRDAIAEGIRELTEGERGKEMRRNAGKWKELAWAAMDEGGSSDRAIEEVVAELAEVS